MRRIMGTEVEYGIAVPGDATANPAMTSTQIVLAYAAAAEIPRARRARWDYEVESPLRDARGFDLGPSAGPPPDTGDLDDLGAANVILTNGARLYVDHAHPEFSAPEVTTPPGAVRVGLGASGDEAGYLLSQRADYIEVEVGLETTLKRGIINTRDEPHADADKYRRLHVIIGDANLSEYSTYLKVGTTALVLSMIEAGVRFDELRLSEPVRSVHRISHDPSLKLLVDTVDGRKLTALDVQRSYFEKACKHVENTLGADVDEATAEVLTIWGEVLDDLAREPLSTADRLDWTAKLRLLEGYRERDGLAWDAPRLHLVDLQYTDVRMAKGLYNRLASRGSIKRLVTEDQVIAAMSTPPDDTRAYFRGRCLERYPTEVAAASWDSVIFDLGRESLVRIPTLEPLRGTRRHVGELFDNSRTAEELVEALTRG